jgi:3-oxoacyl-[acyl-carrier-protein] synthase-3
MMRTRILGTGFVTGEHLVTNEALTQVMETSDQWIRERSGIEQRYYVEEGTTTTDLGAGAARKAIADAGLDAKQIDYIVFATMTPDHFFPGCGALLQSELQLGNIPALDIRQQCTGFIYGLQVSDALIRSGEARTVLLVGAEVHTGFMPFDNWDLLFGREGHRPTPEQREWNTKFRDRTVLFGDAAGACVLRGAEGERGLLGFEVCSDGDAFRDLYVPSCGFAQRPYVTKKDLDEGRPS